MNPSDGNEAFLIIHGETAHEYANKNITTYFKFVLLKSIYIAIKTGNKRKISLIRVTKPSNIPGKM